MVYNIHCDDSVFDVQTFHLRVYCLHRTWFSLFLGGLY